jgi:hypothetical protein
VAEALVLELGLVKEEAVLAAGKGQVEWVAEVADQPTTQPRQMEPIPAEQSVQWSIHIENT